MVPARTLSLLASVFSAAMTLGYGAVPAAFSRSVAAHLGASPSVAEAPSVAPAETAAVDPGRGQESRALVALRSPDFDAIAQQPRVNPRPDLSRPVSVCGTGPDRRVCEADEGSSAVADTSWLVGLRAPDLPVHASLRVERFLKYLTESTAGRKVFRSWLKRSGRYRDTVEKALRDRGMPQDLEALVFVESGFSTQAVSVEGAVGLWQFEPGTARIYGLAVDADYDERRSVDRATEAATKYLSDLYERFGSWELAMAAYDMGYGRLTHRVQDLSTNDYWTLSMVHGALPEEAAAYVPKVLAVALLLRNLDRFGFDTVPLDPPVTSADLDVPGGTPLALVARAAGTSAEQLRALNPEMLTGTVPDRGAAVSVHIPVRGMVRANIMLPQLLSRWHPDDSQDERVDETFNWGTDELGPPRRKAMRGSAFLDEPQPAAASGADADAEEMVETPLERSAQQSEPTDEADGSAVVFYRVEESETLAGIARRFGARPARIAADNHLDAGARLQKGMLLMVHAARSSLSELASMRSFGDRAYPPAMKVDDDATRVDADGAPRRPGLSGAPPRAPLDASPDLPAPLRPRVKRTHGTHGLSGRRAQDVADLFARAKP